MTVLSTETGLTLLSLRLAQRLEALALSHDDHLLLASVYRPADCGGGDGGGGGGQLLLSSVYGPTGGGGGDGGGRMARMIIGINLTGRAVAFQMPVEDIHTEGMKRTHIYSQPLVNK